MAKDGEIKVTKIQFVDQGFKDILNSSGCQNVVYQNTKRISDEANGNNKRGGDGFTYKVIKGSKAKRYIGFVYSQDIESTTAESEDKALTRAVHE